MEKMKRYIVRDREAGNIIERFNTIEEAEKKLKEFENTDKSEGIYTDNFYEIYDAKKEEIL